MEGALNPLKFLKMLMSIFWDEVEESVPIERRLAFDRQERAEHWNRMKGKATDIGEIAELAVQQLAEAKVAEENLEDAVRDALEEAKQAQGRGDARGEEDARGRAAVLAEDLAETRAWIAELDEDVEGALQNQKEAIALVVRQSEELKRLAHKDMMLVSRIRRSEMRSQMLELQEALLQSVPDDRSNLRQRAEDQADRLAARTEARSKVVAALWENQRRDELAQRVQISRQGREIFDQLAAEAGYATKALPEGGTASS